MIVAVVLVSVRSMDISVSKKITSFILCLLFCAIGARSYGADTSSSDALFQTSGRFRVLDSPSLLKGTVTKSPSPFLEGHIETIPEGTKINVQMAGHINSQINQKGDEVIGMITSSTADGE